MTFVRDAGGGEELEKGVENEPSGWLWNAQTLDEWKREEGKKIEIIIT